MIADYTRRVKEWWWLLTLVGGAVLFLALLPSRMKTVEAGVKKAEEQNVEQYRILDRLTYVVEQQQKLEERAAPPQPWTLLREEGDWQVFRDPAGVVQCCDGTVCRPLVGKRCG